MGGFFLATLLLSAVVGWDILIGDFVTTMNPMTMEWCLLKRLLILNSIMLIAGAALAQGNPPGNLTVRSNPPGADVRAEGEASANGITPVTFQYSLIGTYDLRISKRGYETYKTKVGLDPSKETVVDIRLTPKTRFKAAARSLFIPGWGQRYADQKTKGFLFPLMAAGAITAFVVTDHDFQNKFDRFETLGVTYDSAQKAGASNDVMRGHYNALNDAQKRAYDAENSRRVAAGAVIAVWGLSVLDALLFTPEERATFSVKSIAIVPEASVNSFGLRLSKSF